VLKLLVISPSFWPALKIGGPVTSVFDLCRFLREQEIDVTVYTTNVYSENEIKENTFSEIDGVKIYYFGYTKYLEFLGETGWQYSSHLKRKVKENYHNFDIIYIIGIWNFPSTIAIRFLSKKKVPFIVAPHGSLDPFKFSQKGFKKKLYYKLLLGSYIRNSFIHYFTNEEAKKSSEFLNIPFNKIVVIPNGIEIKENSSSNKFLELYLHLKNKFIILYLGRLHPIKGIEVTIESLSYLKDNKDRIHLVIAGKGETSYEVKLRSLVDELSLNELVTFTGHVEGELKSSLLSACNLFVLQSHSEAFSMSILEAMAYGKPLIISSNCNFDEFENEKCGFIIPNNPKTLADKIELLFNDKDLCSKMGDKANKLAEAKYSWENIAREFKHAFEKIIAAKKLN